MATYPALVLGDGPKVYWRLGEAAPPYLDSSGNGMSFSSGQSGGAFVPSQPSLLSSDPVDAALYFNTGWLSRAPIAALAAIRDVFTVEAWVKLTSLTNPNMSIFTGWGGSPYVRITSANKLELLVEGGASICLSTVAITDLNRHHVVVTKNGATVKLYIDGVDVTGTVTNATFSAAPTWMALGTNQAGTDPAKMVMDEIAIYTVALSPAQVTAHYSTGSSPPVPQTITPGGITSAQNFGPSDYAKKILADGPYCYWRLGEMVGTTAKDEKGLFNGTYSGAYALGAAGLMAGDADRSVDFQGGQVATAAINLAVLSPKAWTIEAWFSADTTQIDGVTNIVGIDSTGNDACEVRLGSGAPGDGSKPQYVAYANGYRVILAPTAISLGVRHHIVGTYDGANHKLYVDGAQVGGNYPDPATNFVANAPFRIGASANAGRAFDGRIDEAALYLTALSAAQILAHYNLGTIVPATPQPVGGVASSSAFGAVTVKSVTGGVSSAQAFGLPRPLNIVPVQGIGPVGGSILNTFLCGQRAVGTQPIVGPQQFGTLTFRFGVSVVGLGSAQQFGVSTFRVGSRLLVVGLGSAQQFGVPTFRFPALTPVVGLGSAQRFGAPFLRGGPVTIPIGVGVPSAQAFGVPVVFIVYVRPDTCIDLDLDEITCTELSLEAIDPVSFDLEPAGV